MSRLNWRVYLTLFSFLIGILLTVLLQTQARHRAVPAVNNTSSIVQMIEAMEQETTALENRLSTLRQQLDTLQRDRTSGQSMLSTLKDDVDLLALLTGVVEATGSGIEIILDDNRQGAQAAKAANPATYNPENYIVHDKNILYLVYALRRAGAEAISVNNQRLISTSSVRCVGTVILVNNTRLAPPYVLRAIGNPENLSRRLELEDEISYLKALDYPLGINKVPQLILPDYKGSYRSRYARLMKEGEL